VKLQQPKLRQKSNLESHAYFTEHLTCVKIKPPRKYYEKIKKLEPLIWWLMTRPALSTSSRIIAQDKKNWIGWLKKGRTKTKRVQDQNTRAARAGLDRPARSWWGKALGAQTGLDLLCAKSQKCARGLGQTDKQEKSWQQLNREEQATAMAKSDFVSWGPKYERGTGAARLEPKSEAGDGARNPWRGGRNFPSKKENEQIQRTARKPTSAGQENQIGLH
jgi:hypothetical protein